MATHCQLTAPASLLTAPFGPALCTPAMFFHSAAASYRFPLTGRALLQLMLLYAARRFVALYGVGVSVRGPIDPSAGPRVVVDDHRMRIPREAVVAPAPGPERRSDRDAEPEVDRATPKEARPRAGKNDERVVVRHADECRVHRHDFDIGARGHDHLRIASQIAEFAGLLAHSLHCVHHVLLL